ncbi:MAG: porin family protein [Chitinophagaceae bacterium]
MKIKLSFIVCCALLAGMFSQAQMQPGTTSTSSTGSTSFGIRAGVNFQNLNGKNSNGDKLENDLKPGFHVGVNADIPVATDFYIQPGVLFSTKGAKVPSTTNESKINLSYIEVPVNLLYKPAFGTGRLLLGFGPYVGYAIGGKVKPDNGNDFDIKFQNSVSLAELRTGGYFSRRFDAGANFLAGYEFSSKFSAQLNAQLGLIKTNPDYESISNDKTSIKNTGFGLSLGYRL